MPKVRTWKDIYWKNWKCAEDKRKIVWVEKSSVKLSKEKIITRDWTSAEKRRNKK